MSLWIEWNTDVPDDAFRTKMETIFHQAVSESLRFEQVEVPVEVGLQIVSEEEIRRLNSEYRQIDRVTDVLSFPMLDYSAGGKPGDRVLRAQSEGETDPENGEVCLGDIIICRKRAEEQAAEYGHSLEREMAFLSVHSMLHLLGYDHMVPEEEKVMFEKQERILGNIGLTRS